MDASLYATLSRQSGLMREMQVVAQNIANSSTTGFRREGVTFAEHVARLGGGESLSMAHASGRQIDLSQGGLSQTGGALDIAIEGDGFFLLDTPAGQRLTRAGNFMTSASGEVVNASGERLLDLGGSPISIPPGTGQITLGADGTLSADGQPVAQIGLWEATDPLSLSYEAGAKFVAAGVQPIEGGRLRQGFLEDSNVNPVSEVARMIEVQRSYELGQTFLDREDQRSRGVIETLGR